MRIQQRNNRLHIAPRDGGDQFAVLFHARPRAFMRDPTGHFLLCAGFETGRITVYRIDQQKGTLTEQDSYMAGNVPMWVLIVEIHGR